MKSILDSRWMAWGALLITVAVLVISFDVSREWWAYLDIFFAFMMCFVHLLAVYMRKVPRMSRQLDMCALVFGILTIIAIIGIYIAYAIANL